MQNYEILLPETEVHVNMISKMDGFVGVVKDINISGTKHHPYIRYNVEFWYNGELKSEWFNETYLKPVLNQPEYIGQLGFK